MVRHSALTLALVASCLLAVVSVEAGKPADKEWLEKQLKVYDVMWFTTLPEVAEKLKHRGVSYKIEDNLEHYKNKEWVHDFLRIYNDGMLPFGSIFTPFNPVHLKEAKALFKLFYTAKDFETLYNTATWAKVYVNEYMFVYAFSVAVFHHPETAHMRIPALHEIYPNLFFDFEVMREAHDVQKYIHATHDYPETTTIIHANYTNGYRRYHFHDEWKLSYFTEDIDQNNVQYYAHLAHPFWLSVEEFPDMLKSRGDRFFWSYKLQFVRYYLERACNDMGAVEDFVWDQTMPYPYFPTSSYRNGMWFPHRDPFSKIPSYNYKMIQALEEWEERLSTAIDMKTYIDADGKFVPFMTDEGLKTFGNMVEGNVNSPNLDFYGTYDKFARIVLGFSMERFGEYGVLPGMLEFYGLDQRDPIYWSMVKKMMHFYERFVTKLPTYTDKELTFPGVKIESVDVSPVKTYMTPADYYISNAIKLHDAEKVPIIKARQYRLTHKPFTYTIKVHSDKKTRCDIRIFLGPKHNFYGEDMDMTEGWKYFMILDEWIADLDSGSNKIERKSSDAFSGVPDSFAMSGDEFHRIIKGAMDGTGTYEIPDKLYGFPERMLIPKGKREGFPYQFYVFVTPYNDEKLYQSETALLGVRTFLNRPLGFPLDRPVPENFTDLPNGYSKDIEIFYVDEADANKTT